MSLLDYAGKQAHVELAERMKIRDAGMFQYTSLLAIAHIFHRQALPLR